jgi:uncharacterized protein (TIGR02246 family)
MKKLMIVIALLVSTSPLALTQSHSHGEGQTALADLLFAREKQVAQALVKKDEKTINNLVASDAVIVNPRGRLTRTELMTGVLDPDYSDNTIALSEPQVTVLDKNTAILTCNATGSSTYKGESRTVKGYSTSVWAKRDGEWKSIFHTASVVPLSPSQIK